MALEALDGGRDRAAALVTHDDEQRRLEVNHGVGDAADHVGRDDVPRHADHEQVAETLVEDQLRRHARVAAGQDRRERLLALLEMFAPRRGLVGMPYATLGEPLVSFLQPLESLGGVRGSRFFLPSAGHSRQRPDHCGDGQSGTGEQQITAAWSRRAGTFQVASF